MGFVPGVRRVFAGPEMDVYGGGLGLGAGADVERETQPSTGHAPTKGLARGSGDRLKGKARRRSDPRGGRTLWQKCGRCCKGMERSRNRKSAGKAAVRLGQDHRSD